MDVLDCLLFKLNRLAIVAFDHLLLKSNRLQLQSNHLWCYGHRLCDCVSLGHHNRMVVGTDHS